MVTAIASLLADTLQETLRDGSCLLTGGPTATALTGGPTATALVGGPTATALTGGPTATTLIAGTTTLKSGTGTGAVALNAGVITMTILSVLVVGVLAYGTNVFVRAYIE